MRKIKTHAVKIESNENENISQIDINIDDTQKQSENKLQIKMILVNFFDTMFDVMMTYMRMVGITTLKITKVIVKNWNKFYNRFLKHYVEKAHNSMANFGKLLGKSLRYLTHKLYLFLKFFVDANDVVKKGYNKKKSKGFFAGIGGAVAAFFKGVYNNRRIFVTWINYLFPAAAVVAFGILVMKASDLNFAVGVEYNGAKIGYIQDETVFEKAQAKLQERMIYLKDEEAYEITPKFSLEIVPESEIKDELKITDAIIQCSDTDIVKATGISIDGVFYGAVKDGEQLETTLQERLDKKKAELHAQKVEYAKEVNTETGMFIAKNIKPIEDIEKILNGVSQKDVYYTVKEGQTPIIIAAENDMSLDQLVKLNPTITEKCLIGQQVLINKSEQFLPISTISTETYTEPIAFETETLTSAKLYTGMKQTSREGVAGEKKITATVSRVDGVEVSREIIDSVVTKEPVSQQITKGTAAVPTYDSGGYTGPVSDMGFIWPVHGGYISQGFKGSRHTGIDYAYRGNGRGQPIVAALPGKVIHARKVPSYGNLVKIDHGGGIQTWYAHGLDGSINVKVGQVVAQGQKIMRIGSTGRSSGYHLHFIVTKNGSWQNPLRYLP